MVLIVCVLLLALVDGLPRLARWQKCMHEVAALAIGAAAAIADELLAELRLHNHGQHDL